MMKIHLKPVWVLAMVFALLLTACGGQSAEPTPTPVDPNAIFTQAAATVMAQLTSTAMAFTPTPEPTPTPTEVLATHTPEATPTLITLGGVPATGGTVPGGGAAPTQAGPICDNAVFVADITIPDGTEMSPGFDFEKIWRVRNTGTCTWDEGYHLAFSYGNEKLDGQGWQIVRTEDFVAPGQVKDIGLWMTAPLAPGDYWSCWQMINDRNVPFGGAVCAVIKVVE